MRAAFALLPSGKDAPAGSVACDGLVEGAALDLSHWAGNATPAELKADTSVEIALRYVKGGGDARLAVNNHFDADGALAVYTIVRPEVALAHADLFVAAAEAGDFDEWPANERGLRLEAAIRRLGTLRSAARAYERVIADLEGVLANLDAREELWGPHVALLDRAARMIERGEVEVHRRGDLVAFVHPTGDELPGAALGRAGGPAKWLLFAFRRPDGRFDYRLERARHAWADTVVRPRIAAPSRHAVAKILARELGMTDVATTPGTMFGWALRDDLGMTGVVRTASPIAQPPSAVVRAAALAIDG